MGAARRWRAVTAVVLVLGAATTAVLTIATAGIARAQAGDTPVGRWTTSDGATIDIVADGDGFIGQVHEQGSTLICTPLDFRLTGSGAQYAGTEAFYRLPTPGRCGEPVGPGPVTMVLTNGGATASVTVAGPGGNPPPSTDTWTRLAAATPEGSGLPLGLLAAVGTLAAVSAAAAGAAVWSARRRAARRLADAARRTAAAGAAAHPPPPPTPPPPAAPPPPAGVPLPPTAVGLPIGQAAFVAHEEAERQARARARDALDAQQADAAAGARADAASQVPPGGASAPPPSGTTPLIVAASRREDDEEDEEQAPEAGAPAPAPGPPPVPPTASAPPVPPAPATRVAPPNDPATSVGPTHVADAEPPAGVPTRVTDPDRPANTPTHVADEDAPGTF